MADNYYLTGPTGSQVNIASFVRADPGVDFGDADLLKAGYAENPAQEGARLAYEYVNHRTMSFPVRVASTSALAGAAGGQAWLRTLARPGATLDVQLDGVPTAEAVRFDVLTGRFELDRWNTHMFTQTDRLDGTLKLDVQPFGYWPTMILLASAASVAVPGDFALPNASLIGDVPGLAQIIAYPSGASSFLPINEWKVDSQAWALSGRSASFLSFIRGGASFVAYNLSATVRGDAFAPASQAFTLLVPTSLVPVGSFVPGANLTIPSSIEPAYRGRFRLFAYARMQPSQGLPWAVTADIANTDYNAPDQTPLASAAPIATLWAPGAAGAASPAYHVLDCGELTLPGHASGVQRNISLRLWIKSATVAVPTSQLDFGGVYLLPLDNPAGVVTRGFRNFALVEHNGLIPETRSWSTGSAPGANLLGKYQGVPPAVGASTTTLHFWAGGRANSSGATGTIAHTANYYAQLSVSYRPRFAFLKGL